MAATGLLKDKNMKDMPTVPKLGTQTVSFDSSTTTNRTTAIPGNVCFVRSTVDCWIKRGPVTVTGTTTPADQVFFVGANDGWVDYNTYSGFEYFAVIGATTSGTLLVMETDEIRN